MSTKMSRVCELNNARDIYPVVVRYCFLAGIVVTVIPFGAVQDPPFFFAVCVDSAVLALSVPLTWRNPVLARLSACTLAILVGLSLWVGCQALQLPDNPLAHPVWAAVEAQL